MNKQFLSKFAKFALVGGGVALFDAACFWLALKLFHNSVVARTISVLLAITLSWLINRRFTFHATAIPPGWQEWLRFALSQFPGACTNAVVSVIAYHYLPYAQNNAWLSVACGSAAGLTINFLMANFFVFQRPPSQS
ncbi:UNVERIFIED_ORG: putative flippase GtrA [Zoogloea ramigera]|uniref:GtrA family protein n=1 Tax=Duganella zoogloeoides TaxID=75659 RepID=A0ABZ0XU55_9BURK|nr:GtrA family protein [Duganella zoogloeoides]WQH03267.1 GtrA family protein [Duganella zoogloeoides]